MLSKVIFLNGIKVFFNYSDKLKPTKRIVRECFISWVSHSINKLYVVDFFCGSGIFGFEFFFFKSIKVLNLDIDQHNYFNILNNMIRLNIPVSDEFFIINADSHLWIVKFNILNFSLFIFDPPYNLNNINFLFFEVHRIFFTRKCLFIFLESNNIFVYYFLCDDLFLVKKKMIGCVLFFLLKKI